MDSPIIGVEWIRTWARSDRTGTTSRSSTRNWVTEQSPHTAVGVTRKEEDMIGGTYGKILHVDLTSGDIRVEQPSDDFYRMLVGGRALVCYYLLRDVPAGTDPLSPENLFIVAPGIMQGTNLPGAGRQVPRRCARSRSAHRLSRSGLNNGLATIHRC